MWKPRSKSAIQMFHRCPEQYRRTKMLGDAGDSYGIEAARGVSFHAGAAEVWRQAFAQLNKED